MRASPSGRIASTMMVLFIVCISNFLYPVFAQPSGTGNVHGTVVDVDGAALRSVEVMAYSSSGNLASTKYTNSDGFFRFALHPSGVYSIYFEKEGYVTIKRDITVPTGFYNESESDPVKMGEITLQKALRLSSTVLSRVANPGDTVLFPFTVNNLGEEPEDVQFSVVNSAGWDTRVLDATGEIKRVLLESGSLNLDLEVAVPSTATEAAIVSLTASGILNATLDFTIIPSTSLTRDFELTSTYPSVSEELGRTIYIPLSITNQGETEEIVGLIGIVPSDWTVRFVTDTQMEVLSLYLTADQSEKLTIEVLPPEDAVVGEYAVVVNAVSEESEVMDSLELRVTLREATSDVEIISTFTDVTVEAGKDIDFPIAIWNKGETDALFLLTVLSVPENWKSVFTSEDIEISSVLVTAGESIMLRLEVTPPKAVETGEYPIIAYAESDDGLITKQIDLRVSVGGSHEMYLELSTLYKTLTIGDSVEFTAQVKNIGNSPITTVYLDTAVPEDWKITATPKLVSTLTPRDSVTFTIVADTPADTVAGDYMITVQAMSDQAESEEVDLRVTAKASTSWGFIGIGLAGIAVIGLIIAFTRFKRR